jgi:Holliday junction resolvase RusA-like endonuclease
MIRFFVPGIPSPGGSKKAFVVAGKARIVEDCKRNADWRATVAMVAGQAFASPYIGPVAAEFLFLMPRPKSHYCKAGIRRTAPAYPAVKPDTTKLIRSTEDALKGIAWLDDSQVVSQHALKRYAEIGAPTGCSVVVYEL